MARESKQTTQEATTATPAASALPDMPRLPVERIDLDPTQPRRHEDEEAQRELTDSVRQLGVLQPISVCHVAETDRYRIVSGERRYKAAKAAGLAEIPCFIMPATDDRETLLRQVTENWTRLDLHPYDLADALSRLMDVCGYTQTQLGKLTGKSQGEISKTLSLLRVAPDLQKAAREGEGLPRTHLVHLAQLPYDDQREAAAKIVEGNLTSEEVEHIVAIKKGKKPKVTAPARCQLRYNTSKATVVMTFIRKRRPSAGEIAAALREVLAEVEGTGETQQSEAA